MEENVQKVKQQLMSAHDVSKEGHVLMKELASMFLSEDENFLLFFRLETPLDNSVEFMQIWRKYDADSSGFISAAELCNFLRDLFLHHKKAISEADLEEYTSTMMKIFDKNKDGRLDLNDLARSREISGDFWDNVRKRGNEQKGGECPKNPLHEMNDPEDLGFILSSTVPGQCSTKSKTGALEGPEVDGFVKDMMELVQPSISGVDLDKFREILLRHCDVNKDGKIQKSELALCLGLKINP
ncbi:Secretagogin [Cricetulus griseus]|uniref:Secretagogin n=1 Tax=Cricetulus griseus TaxID=10029 RepID=G3HDV6_CRIGR|nr:Secretagogin [Cricetulus griseus]